MLIILFVVLAAVVVVAIGLVTIGRVSGQLGAVAPTSVYDLDEAVQFVADRLPDEVTAQLSFDDVKALLRWNIDYLEQRGVARPQGVDDLAAGPLVADDDDAVAFVLGRAAEAGMEVDDVWVVQVLDADTAYLGAIGAIGEVITPPVESAD